ncbi:MAG TPA: AAA family ATPase, partial [Glaciihabitans sp.]|nr:AAA family ATPase [Glaciihabitans sp.]
GIRGLVAEHIQVRSGFEAAIAAALGTLSDAVLADSRDAATTALSFAENNELGRIELVLSHAESTGTPASTLSLPDGAVTAISVVTAPPGLLGVLAPVLITDTTALAWQVWDALSAAEQESTIVITRSGDVVSRYILRGGTGARRSRVELIAERDAAHTRLAEVAELIDAARFALAEQRGSVQAAKENAAKALTQLREFDSQLAAQTEQLNRVKTAVEVTTAEEQRLARGLALATESVADAVSAAETSRARLDEARSRPRPILDASARDALVAELDAAKEAEIEARLRVETAKENVRAQHHRATQLQEQLDSERAAAEEAARRAVIRSQQIASAERVLAALPVVLDSVDRSVSEARVELVSREGERAKHNEELATLRREESVLRDRLHIIGEDVHGLEMQIYEKKLHLASLLERAATELGLVEEVLVAEYGPHLLVPGDNPDSDGDPYSREQQQERLAKAERKMSRLGRVNPLALEEFAALEQRHKFLSEQLTDLTNTRKDLLTIIDEIDDKMQHIFSSAFDDTQAAFAEVFPVLFPGGTGSIFLTDPENLLTTGIEVTVKPAGKKIERLSLLSGGERSLAAVALLIAIFKARPSPFYIMDEVEAALDDANLGRLLQIFEDLRQTSQLIVITHQKRTMEIADALYGVSMRADGISAVVGQRVGRPVDQAS